MQQYSMNELLFLNSNLKFHADERTIYVIWITGAETTAKLTKMKVLVYGLRGIGVRLEFEYMMMN